MNNCNILFTSAGRRVSLIRLFRNALKDLGVKGALYAIDAYPHAPALQEADYGWVVSRVTAPNYIDKLLEICVENSIQLVVPTIDTELLILSDAKEKFESEGVTILVSSSEVNVTCFDKRNTYQFFIDNNIDTPRVYDFEQASLMCSDGVPLLMKPAKGSCSKGVTKVNTSKELAFFYDYIDDPIIQEFISGDEYTIDVLLGFDGVVRCAVPRLRVETRAGEISKGITINDKNLINLAYEVSSKLEGAIGCITLQCFKQKDGVVKFIEVNPRFGGGYPLAYEAGADYARCIIQMLLGLKEDYDLQNKWQSDYVMLRYDDAFYIKRDDVEL